MVPVPVTVRLVEIEVAHVFPDPASVQVPEPIAIVRVLLELEDKTEVAPVNEKLYIPTSKVPFVIVNASVELLLDENASCRVTEPFGESIVNGVVKTTPALVSA